MKLEGQVSIKPKPNRAMSLELGLVVLAACVGVLGVYTVGELLLPVACAGLLVFLGQTLRCMGFCFMRQGKASFSPFLDPPALKNERNVSYAQGDA